MKRKRLILLAAAMILMILATSGAYALFRETDINYYGEDAFLDNTGEYDVVYDVELQLCVCVALVDSHSVFVFAPPTGYQPPVPYDRTV